MSDPIKFNDNEIIVTDGSEYTFKDSYTISMAECRLLTANTEAHTLTFKLPEIDEDLKNFVADVLVAIGMVVTEEILSGTLGSGSSGDTAGGTVITCDYDDTLKMYWRANNGREGETNIFRFTNEYNITLLKKHKLSLNAIVQKFRIIDGEIVMQFKLQ